MWKRIIISIFVVAVSLLLISFFDRVESLSPVIKKTGDVSQIITGRILTQTIVPTKEGTSEIGLFCATYNRKNVCSLEVEITEDEVFKKRWVVDCSTLKDNTYYWLDLENCLLEKDKQYNLSVYSDGVEDNAITIYKNSTGKHSGLHTSDMNTPDESLCYQLKYKTKLPMSFDTLSYIVIILIIAEIIICSFSIMMKRMNQRGDFHTASVDKQRSKNQRWLASKLCYKYKHIIICIIALSIVSAVVISALNYSYQVSVCKIGDCPSPQKAFGEILYRVERYDEKNNGRIIKGWVAEQGHNREVYNYGMDEVVIGTYDNIHVILLSENEDVYILPTKLMNRNDVCQHIFKNKNYNVLGFEAFAPNSIIDRIGKGTIMLLKKTESEELLYDLEIQWKELGGNYGTEG